LKRVGTWGLLCLVYKNFKTLDALAGLPATGLWDRPSILVQLGQGKNRKQINPKIYGQWSCIAVIS
jgi:hypothetical protein